MNAPELTELLGWSLLINLSMLSFAAIVLTTSMRDRVLSLHRSMLGLGDEDLLRAYVAYLSQYKVAVFILNVAPYLSLKIMGF